MSASDSEDCPTEDDEPPGAGLERRRAHLGLAPLAPEGRAAIDAAILRNTPAAMRFQQLLALAERLGADFLPSDDLGAWGRALAEIDALAYCTRLIEAQIMAGNVGPGILLPDARLEIEG